MLLEYVSVPLQDDINKIAITIQGLFRKTEKQGIIKPPNPLGRVA